MIGKAKFINLFFISARLAFGAVFLFASFGKLTDPDRFAIQVVRYQILSPRASATVAEILPWLEFLLGLCLILQIASQGTWLLASLLLACFTFARLWVLHRGLSIDCGCGLLEATITPLNTTVTFIATSIAFALWTAKLRPRPTTFLTLSICTVLIMASLTPGQSVPAPPRILPDQPHPSLATSIRLTGCRSLQPQLDTLLQNHHNDSSARQLQDRLVTLDHTADQILIDIDLRQTASLDQSIDDADEDSTHAPLGAIAIVDANRADLSTPLDLAGFSPADRGQINQYLQIAQRSLTTIIQAHARTAMATTGSERAELLRLGSALPMMLSDNTGISDPPPPSFIRWAKTETDHRTLELFAAQSGSPRIAFALSRFASTPTTEPTDLLPQYLRYVSARAQQYLQTDQPKAAWNLLHDAAALAGDNHLEPQRIDFSFHAADVLEMIQSSSAAATEMDRLKATLTDDWSWRRATVMRLQYLFDAHADQAVECDAQHDLTDPRCAPVLPQIIYTAWLSALRRDATDAAAHWRTEFLTRFPADLRAAAIYFEAAKESFATGDLAQAIRLLRFIEYQFPQYADIKTVRQMETRLSSLAPAPGVNPQ
jgi:uncharacterized membrane protein YphA (DoxX/SURF4 family)